MILPVHDVKAPEEVIEPPCAGTHGSDPASVSGNEYAGIVGVGERDPPSRKRSSIFGAFLLD